MDWTLVWCLLLVVYLELITSYKAVIYIELARFRTLNKDVIAEGSCCDSRYGDGKWNPCDFVFYLDVCQKGQLFGRYSCQNKVERFYAPANTEDVIFNSSVPRPLTVINLDGAFPSNLVVNITVYDEDDGFSSDDYIGSYQLNFFPDMLNQGGRGGEQFAPEAEHYVTIPEHSEIVIKYKAYCLDFECRNSNIPQFLNLVQTERPPNSYRISRFQVSNFPGGNQLNNQPRQPLSPFQSSQVVAPLPQVQINRYPYPYPQPVGNENYYYPPRTKK